jgi:hypothetical protein
MILKFGMRHRIGGVSGAWAQHRGKPQFRNSDHKIGPAIAGSPAIQFAACDATGDHAEAISANTALDEPYTAGNTRVIFPYRAKSPVVQ